MEENINNIKTLVKVQKIIVYVMLGMNVYSILMAGAMLIFGGALVSKYMDSLMPVFSAAGISAFVGLTAVFGIVLDFVQVSIYKRTNAALDMGDYSAANGFAIASIVLSVVNYSVPNIVLSIITKVKIPKLYEN